MTGGGRTSAPCTEPHRSLVDGEGGLRMWELLLTDIPKLGLTNAPTPSCDGWELVAAEYAEDFISCIF